MLEYLVILRIINGRVYIVSGISSQNKLMFIIITRIYLLKFIIVTI